MEVFGSQTWKTSFSSSMQNEHVFPGLMPNLKGLYSLDSLGVFTRDVFTSKITYMFIIINVDVRCILHPQYSLYIWWTFCLEINPYYPWNRTLDAFVHKLVYKCIQSSVPEKNYFIYFKGQWNEKPTQSLYYIMFNFTEGLVRAQQLFRKLKCSNRLCGHLTKCY